MGTREQIRQQISETTGIDLSDISEAALLTDVVTSSFLLVETVIELQERFEVRFDQSDMKTIATVGQLIDLVKACKASLIKKLGAPFILSAVG